MLAQFARQALGLGEHLTQSHLLRGAFNHVNSSPEETAPITSGGRRPGQGQVPRGGPSLEYANRRPQNQIASSPP